VVTIITKEEVNELIGELSVWEPVYRNVEVCLQSIDDENIIKAFKRYKYQCFFKDLKLRIDCL